MNKTTKRRNTFLEYIENSSEIASLDHDTFLYSLYDKSNLIKLLQPFFLSGKVHYDTPDDYIILKNKKGNISAVSPTNINSIKFKFPCKCGWNTYHELTEGEDGRLVEYDCESNDTSKFHHDIEIKKCIKFMKDIRYYSHDIINSFDERGNFIENYEFIETIPISITNRSQELDVVNIEIERMLSNDYKEFGFLDLSFTLTVKVTEKFYIEKYNISKIYSSNIQEYFGFIELKTGNISFGQLTREMEFYKSVIPKSQNIPRGDFYRKLQIFSLAIADVQTPKGFDQYHIIPFGKKILLNDRGLK